MICVGDNVRLKKDAPESIRLLEIYRHLWEPDGPIRVEEIKSHESTAHAEGCEVLLPGEGLCMGECTNFTRETLNMLVLTFTPPQKWYSSESPGHSFPIDWFESV